MQSLAKTLSERRDEIREREICDEYNIKCAHYHSCDYCRNFQNDTFQSGVKNGVPIFTSHFGCKALNLSFWGKAAYSFGANGLRVIPSICDGRYEPIPRVLRRLENEFI